MFYQLQKSPHPLHAMLCCCLSYNLKKTTNSPTLNGGLISQVTPFKYSVLSNSIVTNCSLSFKIFPVSFLLTFYQLTSLSKK